MGWHMWKISIGVVVALLISGNTAMATCTVPNELQNGQTADAELVMANFTSIANCVVSTANPTFTGSMGINTVSPVFTLDVRNTGGASIGAKSTSAGGAVLSLDRSTSSLSYASQISFSSAGAPDFAMGTSQGSAAASDFSIYSYGGAGNAFTIKKSNGYVGILANSPTYPLYVNGTVYATAGAGGLSDIRHKSHVVSLEKGALDQVMRLRPVSFTWKTPTDAGMRGRQMGFIAQEVEKVFPSAILTENNAEKTKGLKYNELIAVLTKALQEQQAEIRSLKAANDNHVQAVTDLATKLGTLERRVRLQTAQK